MTMMGFLGSTRRLSLALVCLAHLTTAGTHAQDEREPRLPRIAIDELLSGPPAAELAAGASPLPVPVLARVRARLESDLDALDARLNQHASRKTPVWLSVQAPSAVEGVERWRTVLQGVLSRHGRGIAVVEIEIQASDAKLAAYAVRLAATEIRAERDTIQVGLGGMGAEQAATIYTSDLAPYLDLLILPDGSDLGGAEGWLVRVDPGAQIGVTGMNAGASADRAVQRVIDSEIETIGTGVTLHAWLPSEGLAAGLRALAPVAPLMRGNVSVLDGAAANLVLSAEAPGAPRTVRHRLLFDGRTFTTYLIYWSDPSPEPLQLSLTLPVEGTPTVRRLADGATYRATDYSRVPESGAARARVPAPGGPMLIDFSEGAGDVLVQRSDVTAERQLSVEEIIARHQQQQRAQDALVRSYIATARMDQHFRPTMTDPGYDVASTNRYFVSGTDVEWEELSFSVNGTKWGPDRPAFPLLQAEKVLSLPLQLRFDSDYSYRLAGTERVGDYDCYVVRFNPSGADRSLYRGTVWIERRTFARVKVQATQTSLAAPVVSNEEIQTYAPVASIANRPVFLFSGLSARQIMLIAGRNLLVEKSVVFSDFRVNPEDFEGSRAEARRSDRIMYRETDRGLRYYVKQGDTRVVSDRATSSARAMAMGVTLDPSYAFPLPIFGINYLDFEFRGPDSQLAILFAGVLAAGNVQRPKIGSTPLDASVDFFAIAVPSSDRLYGAAGEHEEERLLTWPLTTGDQPGVAVHALPEALQLIPVPVRRLHPGHHDLRDLPGAGKHHHQRSRRGMGVPPRRLQRGGERGVVRAFGLAGVGRVRRRRDARRVRLHEVQREPVAGFLLQCLPQDPPQWRVVRRTRSRSLCEVPVRHVRRHPHSRRPGVRRPLPGTGSRARLLLVQHLRAVPAGPVPRAGMGTGPRVRRNVAADHRHRRRHQPARALEHDAARRRREEFPAGALPRHRLCDAAGYDPETAAVGRAPNAERQARAPSPERRTPSAGSRIPDRDPRTQQCLRSAPICTCTPPPPARPAACAS